MPNTITIRTKTVLALTLGVLTGMLATFTLTPLYASWTAPTAAPPDGNVQPPLHAGNQLQIKQGGLVLNSLGGSSMGLLVANGPVGIGTGINTPAAALEVAGKAVTQSTAVDDPGNTLTTKDYVDAQAGNAGQEGSPGGGGFGFPITVSTNYSTYTNGDQMCAPYGLQCVCVGNSSQTNPDFYCLNTCADPNDNIYANKVLCQ